MTADAAVLKHTGGAGGSLTISSTNGYVGVESVRITDAKIGVSANDDLITLSATEMAVDGKVSSTTLETTGAATLDSATVTNALSAGATTVTTLTASDDLQMTEDAALITHSGGTSLTIKSASGGFVKIDSSSAYVDVESVRFTGANIGLSAKYDLVALSSTEVIVDGKVTSTTLQTSAAATFHSATVQNDLTTSGNTVASQLLSVGGAHTETDKKLYVHGDVKATASATFGGDLVVNSKFTVTANDGGVDMDGSAAVGGGLTVGGQANSVDKFAVSSSGDLTISANGAQKFKVTASNGNVDVDGALSVDGNLALGTIQTIEYASGAETVDHGKSFVLISRSFTGWSISYDSNGTPTAGQMLFIRNNGADATTNSMGYSLLAGASALYVYDGSAWQVIMG